MAIDMFLKLDSVTGESTDSSHAGEIEVASFSHSVSNQSTVGSGTSGSGAGKASFGALKIVARTNNSSATLFQVSASGDHFKTAKLTARKAGKSQQEYFTSSSPKCMFPSIRMAISHSTPTTPAAKSPTSTLIR